MPEGKGSKPIIVVKKKGGDEGAAHGGAWKIAYADFMTALMAFFLVMWLINATSEEQKRGIAQFFNPLAQTQTLPGAANGMLEAPSPMTAGTALKKIKNSNVLRPVGAENKTAQLEHGAGRQENMPQLISQKNPSRLTPINPAIIPVGGVSSGGGRLLPSVGAGEVSALAMKKEEERLSQALRQLHEVITQNVFLRKLEKTISFQYRRNEIRIELHDTDNVSMFDSASGVPNKQGQEMLKEIAAWLAPLPEQISIIGCTDSSPYHGKLPKGNVMSNWTLSLVRADSARRTLVQDGYPDGKIRDVDGLGDRDLADPTHPASAGNRRVIIVLHKKLPESMAGMPAQTKMN